MIAYAATTDDITVTVRPGYLDGQSDLFSRRFVFGYFVQIENQSGEEVQLIRRHWIIRETNGRMEEVEGEGVVGIQPVIGPGERHEYTSFCVLYSFEGSMEGSYLMQRASGERLRVMIPRFSLRAAAN